MGFELDMMLPPSQLEMPSPLEEKEGMTTSITIDPSNLASLSIYLPSFIAILSLAITLARIATLPLDCAIVTRPGQGIIYPDKTIYKSCQMFFLCHSISLLIFQHLTHRTSGGGWRCYPQSCGCPLCRSFWHCPCHNAFDHPRHNFCYLYLVNVV